MRHSSPPPLRPLSRLDSGRCREVLISTTPALFWKDMCDSEETCLIVALGAVLQGSPVVVEKCLNLNSRAAAPRSTTQ
eukprot:12179061-Alexandrium_andersonii.AAC.1